MRKFKILKDTPQDKAGDIFEQYWVLKEDNLYAYQNITGKQVTRYSTCNVENNPEWFEEIIEPKFETDFSKLKNLKGYYATDTNISYYDVEKNHGSNLNHHDLFSTRLLAKSCLALAQLSQFAKEWNSLVKNKDFIEYSVLLNEEGELYITGLQKDSLVIKAKYPIRFYTHGLAELSLQHHKDLWLDYYQINNEEN